jgi:UDP-glucose 4-epimerase
LNDDAKIHTHIYKSLYYSQYFKNFNLKMKVIVTGGAGFIGSHLVDGLLDLGHEVVVLDNFSTGRKANLDHVKDKIKLVKCDLSNKGEWIEEFKNVDWVFHLASLADIVPSIQNPESYFRSNVDATFYVLEAARHANVKRFVYSASSSCYGIPDQYPTPEESDIRPQYPYALAKRMGEELVEHWAQLYNLPAISLRFFNVYGTRSRTSGTYGAVFGVFLAQKLANKPYTVVGDGNQTRDFTYVTDIVSALIAAAESEKTNKIYNVGSDTTVSVNKIVELLGGNKVNIPKRPGEPDCTYADISKIKDELGWCPTISIEEGVDKILKNIDYWKEATVWNPDSISEATEDWFKYLSD